MVLIISYYSFITEAETVSFFTSFILVLSTSLGPEQVLKKFFKMLNE